VLELIGDGNEKVLKKNCEGYGTEKKRAGAPRLDGNTRDACSFGYFLTAVLGDTKEEMAKIAPPTSGIKGKKKGRPAMKRAMKKPKAMKVKKSMKKKKSVLMKTVKKKNGGAVMMKSMKKKKRTELKHTSYHSAGASVTRSKYGGWITSICPMTSPEDNALVCREVSKLCTRFPKLNTFAYDRACKICKAWSEQGNRDLDLITDRWHGTKQIEVSNLKDGAFRKLAGARGGKSVSYSCTVEANA